MDDDLVKQLRFTADDVCRCGTSVCLEAADHIEQLETKILEWQKIGSAATQAMSDAVDDCVRATKLAKEKHEQVEMYSALCNRQAQTMAEMSAQIDELAELAGIAVKPTRQ
jgi:hypothetical protein